MTVKANITGAWYSSRNAGDQAILIAIRELLEARVPDLRLQVICSRADFVRAEHGLPAISQTDSVSKVLLDVARSDLLVLGGGTPFYDNFKHMAFFWALAALCKLGGGKVAVYGVSAQKLNTRAGRWFTRRITNMADLVTVREDVTADQLRRLGVKRPIHCTADPAITLKPCARPDAEAILRAEGVPADGRPVFGICPHFFSNTDAYRVHHYELFSNDVLQGQQRVLAEVAAYLAGQGHVVFLPMNTDAPDSDVDVGRQIQALLPAGTADVHFVERQYRPRQIAGVLSLCKLVVGVRLHSLILSAAVETPVVAIDYAPKVNGFLRLLDNSGFSVSVKDLSTEAVVRLLESVLGDYDAKKAAYVEKVRALKMRAEENADMLARLVGATHV